MRFAFSNIYILLLKFWVYSRTMPRRTIGYRNLLNFPLHFLRSREIYLSSRIDTRGLRWMSSPVFTHKRGIHILRVLVHTSVPRDVLLQVRTQKSVIKWNHHYDYTNGYLFPRICSSMRSNILLSCRRHH